MTYVKSEMQRIREVMAREGYHVLHMEYTFALGTNLHYNEADPQSPLTSNGWERMVVTFEDWREPEAHREALSVYLEPYLTAYNLAMWEACGFRSGDPEADPEGYQAHLDSIKAWQKEFPVPVKDRDERDVLERTLFSLAVT